MFRTLTLRRRLMTISVAVIAAFVLLGLALTVLLSMLSGSLSDLHHRAAHGIEVIHEVEIELGAAAEAALLLTYADGAQARADAAEALDEAMEEAAEEIDELRETVVRSDADQGYLDRIVDGFEAHQVVIDQHVAMVAAGDLDDAVAAVPTLGASRAMVSAEVDAFMEHIEATADAIHDDAVARIAGVNRIAFVVLTLLSVVAFAVTWHQVTSVSRQVGRSAGSVTRSSSQLAGVARTLADGAEQTAERSNAVSAGAEQVSANVQMVATAVEELTTSVDEIGRSTTDATAAVGEAVQQAATAGATVNALGAASREIGDVIELIDEIAEQTNLLALNATIEAARAGESGKGFAVVANEVKELAAQTSKATDDIRMRIGAIQEQSGSAVEAIASIQDTVGRVDDLQGVIASAIEEQTVTTREVATNVVEAASGSTEISDRVTGVAELANETSSGAEATLTTAAELAQLAAELQALVGGGAALPAPAQGSDTRVAAASPQAPHSVEPADASDRVLTTAGR